MDDVIRLATEIQLDGLVATNTTISRPNLITDKTIVEKIGAGRIFGFPVQKRSTEVVEFLLPLMQNKN